MKQSIGTGTILNIIIIFFAVVIAAITGIISYNKAYKVSTRIGDAIERAEGYNSIAKTEIDRVLGSLGYLRNSSGGYLYSVNEIKIDNKHYQYEITTYMYFNFPLINSFKVPIKTKTDRIYRFGS